MPIRSLPAQRACASLSVTTAQRHAQLQLDRFGSQCGQSMTEYLVALAVLAAIIAGTGASDPSVLQLFLDSVRIGWARLLSALALPI